MVSPRRMKVSFTVSPVVVAGLGARASPPPDGGVVAVMVVLLGFQGVRNATGDKTSRLNRRHRCLVRGRRAGTYASVEQARLSREDSSAVTVSGESRDGSTHDSLPMRDQPANGRAMTKRTGGRILVDQLRIQGCDRIFTVPGESFLAVLDALHDTPEIDVVTCRQEGGVAYMADADGKMTGRPGVAFVTRGPGATNASAGVHVAFQDSTPMILFVGDVARGDRDREGFQEINFPTFFAPIAKWAARIEDARRIPEYVARAWRVATAGRPGPVVLAIPEDMLRDEVEAADRPKIAPIAQPPCAGVIQALFELLKTATNPVAIVGGADWSPRASHH